MQYRGDRKPKQAKVETPKPVEAVKEQPKQKPFRGIQQKLF